MKTVAGQQIERAVFGMAMGLGGLLADLGIIYITCWGARFDSLAVLISVSYTAMILAVIIFNAVRYTEFRLNRFYNTPMCPIQDMVWDVEDLIIEPVEENDEPD